jgi:hypothetical protein
MESTEIKKEVETPITDATVDMISRAEQAAARLEEANKQREEILNKEKEFQARLTLMGRGQGQIVTPPKDPKEIVKDEINQMFKQLSPYSPR